MRKSIVRTLFITALFSALLTVSAFAENGTVSGSWVNFRSGPGLNYSVIDCLDLNTEVTVTDRSNPDWWAVSYNGSDGFISSAYVKVTEEQAAVEETSAGTANGTINAMYVRFRSGPSLDSSILTEYSSGKELTITGTSGEWTAVIIDGTAGYVYSTYVTAADAAPAAETAAEPAPEVTPEPAPEPTPAPAEPAADTTSGTPGSIAGDQVNFRSGPSTGYTILNCYNRGKELTITGRDGDWTAVVIDGTAGYVFSQYVSETAQTVEAAAEQPQTETPAETPAPVQAAEEKPGYITGNNVRFRDGASMSANIIGEFMYGNAVSITGTSGDWTAVDYDGVAGFVYSSYIQEGTYTISVPEQSTENQTAEQVSSYDKGAEIANFALQYVGYNYVWGGKSPDTGFDCSGFVYYVYSQFGYTLNRVACDQAKNGVHVDAGDLQPGDILCFYSGSDYIGHVGIYIGDNKFVHSSNSITGVIVSELSGYYTSRGYEARRIVG